MRPLVKICGIRRLDDAVLAAELGAAAVGFVFWPGSPRFLDPFRARPIVAALPPFVTPVGVFVDQPPELVADIAGLLKLGAVQLHGQESVEAYARCGVRVIKAIPVTESFDVATLGELPERITVLLDAHDPIKRGGTGRTIDWTRAAEAARTRRVILSGGLNPGNVAAAVEAVAPYAIDVSSGVESAPGIKEPRKLQAFVEAIGFHQPSDLRTSRTL